MDLHSAAIKKRAFIERVPIATAKAELGAGLYRAGNVPARAGGLNPQIVAALMPALGELGKAAVPSIVSGVSKVGAWIKRLLGLGMVGGMRAHKGTNPDGKYHDLEVFQGTMKPEDKSLYLEPRKAAKYTKRMGKIEGGFAVGDVPAILKMAENPKYARKLEKYSGKPHKFINFIHRKLNKKKA